MKLLIVGFGFMGQTHCGNLLKMPDVEITGIVDPVLPLERLRTVKGNLQTVNLNAQDVSKIAHFTNLEEAINQTNSDAAVICLPTFLHESSALMALENNLHVFVEKPFALTEEECDNMLRCAEEKQRLIAVGYVVRKSPVYCHLHETVKSNRLGKLKFLKLRRITGIPTWGNWSNPATIKAVGGSLFDLVSHDIDFARFLLGEPEKITVDPYVSSEFNGNYTSAMMHFPETLVSIEGGFVTPPGYPFSSTYKAFFEHGTITGNSDGKCLEYDCNGKCQTVKLINIDPYYAEMKSFIDALSRNGEIFCSGYDASRSVKCCKEIQRQLNITN